MATSAGPGSVPLYSPPPPRGDDTGGIIPYKNPKALVAYYCAVFALIPVVGLILGPLALWLGIAGWRDYRRQPVVRGAAHAWIGIILGGLCLAANLAGIALMLFLPRSEY